MPRLAIEVDGRVIASIHKGNLDMKPPAREHFSEAEEQECLAAAQSAT